MRTLALRSCASVTGKLAIGVGGAILHQPCGDRTRRGEVFSGARARYYLYSADRARHAQRRLASRSPRSGLASRCSSMTTRNALLARSQPLSAAQAQRRASGARCRQRREPRGRARDRVVRARRLGGAMAVAMLCVLSSHAAFNAQARPRAYARHRCAPYALLGADCSCSKRAAPTRSGAVARLRL